MHLTKELHWRAEEVASMVAKAKGSPCPHFFDYMAMRVQGSSSSSSSSSSISSGSITTTAATATAKATPILEHAKLTPLISYQALWWVASRWSDGCWGSGSGMGMRLAALGVGRVRAAMVRDMEHCQLAALAYVGEHARVLSTAAMPGLTARCAGLGITEPQLVNILTYIRTRAPIIIHVHTAVLSLLTADTHYRNQFETKRSCGTLSTATRTTWERSLFGPSYDEASPFERCKYGTVNPNGDPLGVATARVYGNCYLVLKEEVRYRTTFASMDSGDLATRISSGAPGVGRSLATCEHYAHVLLEYTDADLGKVLRLLQEGVLQSLGVASVAGSNYKEAQVHGEVRLDRDVEALVVPEADRGVAEAAAAAFGARHGVHVRWAVPAPL